jgi:hypothetical protein
MMRIIYIELRTIQMRPYTVVYNSRESFSIPLSLLFCYLPMYMLTLVHDPRRGKTAANMALSI